jgi:AcrR family transcriptional regulator
MSIATAKECTTSDLIRTVAGKLFCQSGYKGLGMRSLAAEVGIQPGSLYNHIESKQALLYELISEYEMQLLQIFKAKSVARSRNAIQMNSSLWAAVSKFVEENYHLAQVSRTQIQHLDPDQADSVIGIRLRRKRQLLALLTQCSGDLGLSEEGLERLSGEVTALLDCYINLGADPAADPGGTLKRQLHNMASMLLVKRD